MLSFFHLFVISKSLILVDCSVKWNHWFLIFFFTLKRACNWSYKISISTQKWSTIIFPTQFFKKQKHQLNFIQNSPNIFYLCIFYFMRVFSLLPFFYSFDTRNKTGKMVILYYNISLLGKFQDERKPCSSRWLTTDWSPYIYCSHLPLLQNCTLRDYNSA